MVGKEELENFRKNNFKNSNHTSLEAHFGSLKSSFFLFVSLGQT